jgi:Lysozyme like domain
MANQTYAQLEQLWTNAGGSAALAPVMAAIALAESSGNPNAYNSSGASGLWQIEIPENAQYVPGGAANVFNPQDNAAAAVAIEEVQGLGAWVTYTNGAYEQFMQGSNTTAASSSTATASNPSGSATYSTLGTTSIINTVSGLAKDIAIALDYTLGIFGRGQGWRIVFTVLTVVTAYMAYKCLSAVGFVPDVNPPVVVPV